MTYECHGELLDEKLVDLVWIDAANVSETKG
jgi:hypothetical protein